MTMTPQVPLFSKFDKMVENRCNRIKYIVTDSKGRIVKVTYSEAMTAVKKSKNLKSLRSYVSRLKKLNRKC